MCGVKENTQFGPFRDSAVKRIAKIICRLGGFMAGLAYIKVERPDVDYSKYLGPNWEKTYKGESTVINNHSSWMVFSY